MFLLVYDSLINCNKMTIQSKMFYSLINFYILHLPSLSSSNKNVRSDIFLVPTASLNKQSIYTYRQFKQKFSRQIFYLLCSSLIFSKFGHFDINDMLITASTLYRCQRYKKIAEKNRLSWTKCFCYNKKIVDHIPNEPEQNFISIH